MTAPLDTALSAVTEAGPEPAANDVAGMHCYDAGLLASYGGGDVSWWQDYIRAELGRAHDFYGHQFTARLAALQALCALLKAEVAKQNHRIVETLSHTASLRCAIKVTKHQVQKLQNEMSGMQALLDEHESWTQESERRAARQTLAAQPVEGEVDRG